MKSPGSSLFIRLLAVNVIAFVPIGTYLAFAAMGQVPANGIAFMGLLALLALPNLASLGLSLRNPQPFSLLARIMRMEWAWFIFWFAVFAPPYVLLTLSLNRLQFLWASLGFVWEVPSFGILYLFLCMLMFRPLKRYLDGAKNLPEAELRRLYAQATQYPRNAAFLICVLSAVGFALGAAQLRFFAHLPLIEDVKNYSIGFVAAIFLAVIYYVSLRSFLDPLCSELEERVKLAKRTRAGISGRVILVSVMTVVGSLALIQLIVIKSFQSLVRDEVASALQEDIVRGAWDQNIIAHSTIIESPSASELTTLGVSPEAQQAILWGRNGITDDFNDSMKIEGFFTDASGNESLAIVPLDDFYGPLTQTILSFLIGAFFVLLAGLGIAALAARAMTRSLQVLTNAIRSLEKDPQAPLPTLATGDEIQELSEALNFFVRRSQLLDKEKDEFISIASHHLRTPVTELNWLVGSLEKGNIEQNIHEFLPEIKASAGHLSELVKLLLDTHRFDDASMAGTPAEAELVGIVKGVMAKYEPFAKRKKIAVHLTAPDTLNGTTDVIFLTIILESLISNAVEYTPEGGAIMLTLSTEGEEVRFTCTDTGIGIADSDQEHLFAKFMRGKNAQVVKATGTGLGLYVAKQAVERLGGSIKVSSTLGKGATFTVLVPKVFKPRETVVK